ncbi:hypothetical protein JWG39_12055 [Desulforhopalus vacuolatus]|nr:hypothetical protein [Desulforhopalus vacuolatus]
MSLHHRWNYCCGDISPVMVDATVITPWWQRGVYVSRVIGVFGVGYSCTVIVTFTVTV